MNEFQNIMTYTIEELRELKKESKYCIGCKEELDKRHVHLCHECANTNLSDDEFDIVVERFRVAGFFREPNLITRALLKTGLVKEKTYNQ